MAESVEIVISFCLLATTTICCWRFYLRLVGTRQYIAIELTLLAGLICYLAFSGMQLRMVNLINAASSPQDVVVIQKYFFAGTFFYLGCLWSVKISVNLLHMRLTNRLPELFVWTSRSLWMLILALPVMYVIYLVGCLPIHRQWDSPLGIVEACPPITRRWDFWIHFAVHILTDIWLCALPLTILIRIQEKRLRIAVCSIYGLTLISIIVFIIRTILLTIDVRSNMKRIFALTSVELSTTIIVGSLPGISSRFTKKYVYGNTSDQSKPSGDRSRKTVTARQQHPWQSLDQNQESSDYMNYVELSDIKALSVGAANARRYTKEEDAASADHVESGVPVAVTMI